MGVKVYKNNAWVEVNKYDTLKADHFIGGDITGTTGAFSSSISINNTAVTLNYNSTTECLEFNFS